MVTAALWKKLKRWDRVEVTWEDHFVSEGVYQADTWLSNFKPCIRRTVGYIVELDADHVHIAETDDREAHCAPSDIERVNSFMRCAVTAIKVLR